MQRLAKFQGRQLDQLITRVDKRRKMRGSLGGGVCHFCGYMALPLGERRGEPYFSPRCPECGGRVDP